jgi:vacuolar-type H+-ATPase subunit E/Vma4
MIDGLLATLERNALAEIARIEADGRARAQAITDAAERRMRERRDAALGARRAEGRAVLERALAAARRVARERVLEARAALLDRVFAAIRALLPEVATTAEYQACLANELEQARAFTAERSAVVRCAPALAEQLRQVVRTNGRLKIEPDGGISAGFRVATQDGALEVDATLEGRLRRAQPRIAIEALAALKAAR